MINNYLQQVRRVLGLAAVGVLASLVTAQAQHFEGKIVLGLNASQIDGDGLSGFNKAGALFGVAAAFPFNEKFSIEPQLLFSQKGSKSSNDELDKGYPYIIFRTSYLELPVLLNYQVSNSPELHLQGGLSFNYLLSASVDNGTNLGFVDAQDSFNQLDLCGQLGFEYRIASRWGLHVRHSYSLKNMNKNWLYIFPSNPNANIRSNAYNNTLSFSLRYLLNRN